MLEGKPPLVRVVALNEKARLLGMEVGMTKLQAAIFAAAEEKGAVPAQLRAQEENFANRTCFATRKSTTRSLRRRFCGNARRRRRIVARCVAGCRACVYPAGGGHTSRPFAARPRWTGAALRTSRDDGPRTGLARERRGTGVQHRHGRQSRGRDACRLRIQRDHGDSRGRGSQAAGSSAADCAARFV